MKKVVVRPIFALIASVGVVACGAGLSDFFVNPGGARTFDPATLEEASVLAFNGATKPSPGQQEPGQHIYFVHFENEPLATYRGGIVGLAATALPSDRPRGAPARLDVKSDESRAYLDYLSSKHKEFRKRCDRALGRSTEPLFDYNKIFNGMALRLTAKEAAQVATIPVVVQVEKDSMNYLTTDVGPKHIGADEIWNGTATGTEHQGEGVIVGIIDTGINVTSRSFAATGDDGYTHTNPFAADENPYKGDCIEEPSLCNDKLIGVYGYPEITAVYSDQSFPAENHRPPYGVDYNGHGSHTASTSAGNVLFDVPDVTPTGEVASPGTPTGVVFARISGVAPHANIISYQVCLPGNDGDSFHGCPGTASVQAIEDAIADGVDVINFSISGGGDPWNDAVELAFLNAHAAGIFVAASAGNEGPSPATTGHNGPWLTSVAAATHGRVITANKTISDFLGGATALAGPFHGQSISGGITAPIVYAGDFTNANDPDGDPAQCLQPFPEGTFDGQIVVCERGAIARVEKIRNLAAGGGGGGVLANVVDGATTVDADPYVLPGIHINAEDGTALRAWLAEGTGHTATITAAEPASEQGPADVVAAFSSRGPAGIVTDLTVPNVTAPGVDIFAAYANDQPFNDVTGPGAADWARLQGTSMSSPHVAGAAALVAGLHSDWTPAEVKSALMMTAKQDILATQIDGSEAAAGFFDMGSGRVQVAEAAKAGLLLNETPENFLAANPDEGGDAATLNLASMAQDACLAECEWTRVVKATVDSSWTATTAAISEGVSLRVSPAEFTLAAEETQEITIQANVLGLPPGTWAFGQVTLTPGDESIPTANLPVVAGVSYGDLPTNVSLVASRDADSFLLDGLRAIAAPDLTVRAFGLARADQELATAAQDSDNSSAFDDLSDGVHVKFVDVPDGALRLITEILASSSPDLDLFVGLDDGDGVVDVAELLCVSATGTALESCVLDSPEAGSYWLVVQNWAASAEGAEDAFIMASAALMADDSAGNFFIDAPRSVGSLEPFSLRLFWDEDMAPGDLFYGAFDIGPDADRPGVIGATSLRLVRGQDDVTLSVDTTEVQVGEAVTFNLSVLANYTPEDRAYTIEAAIPEGLEVDPASVTGDGVAEGDTVRWEVTQPSLVGTEGFYIQSTNDQTSDDYDQMCDTGFGGYVDLAAFGIGPQPGLSGNDAVFDAFGAQNPFQFYGGTYAGVGFSTNGLISFSGEDISAANVGMAIPDESAPNGLLAMFWDDLSVVEDFEAEKMRGISIATAGPEVAIVEYDGVQRVSDPEFRIDFEAVVVSTIDNTPGFYEIAFAYNNVGGELGDTASVGVENLTGTDGVSYAGPIFDGLVVCYDYVEPGVPLQLQYIATADDRNQIPEVTIGKSRFRAAIDWFFGIIPSVLTVNGKVKGPAGTYNVALYNDATDELLEEQTIDKLKDLVVVDFETLLEWFEALRKGKRHSGRFKFKIWGLEEGEVPCRVRVEIGEQSAEVTTAVTNTVDHPGTTAAVASVATTMSASVAATKDVKRAPASACEEE